MTDLTSEQYCVYNGQHCPSCKSSNIFSGDLDWNDGGQVTQAVSCSDCRMNWTDVYDLSGYTDLEGET